MGSWAWISATTTGTSHTKAGIRRQDAYRCYCPNNAAGYLVCVVSDGAGSASYGGEGAALVCRTFSTAAQAHLSENGTSPDDEVILGWLDQIRDRITFAALSRGKTPRDFAATMIAVLSNGHETLIVQVGDGCLALRFPDCADWEVPIWPDHGEYASTTSFVTDDPQVKCRIHRELRQVAAMAAMTDGLERLALDFKEQKPFSAFFEGISKPVLAAASPGKMYPLSSMLKEYLDGEAICSRTDDDKTLVVAARV
jgi:hypothetical protein